MGIIKKLTLHETQKIAAGEVVERPASVIKELVENALDAGATKITIYIEQSGKKCIRVVDNGSGMDKDDASYCFEHHATSKISTVNELEKLTTFGFRGEALSSIAAVSKVTLITKKISESTGVKVIKDHHNEIINEEASPDGTDISIADLFFNVPARKKFLKSEATEWRNIVTLFQAFCFAYPLVHFKLFSDNQLIHNYPPCKSAFDRTSQIFESSLAQNIKQLVEFNEADINISGCISTLGTYRYDRSTIFFFVNNRWVKNSSLTKILMKAYLGILPPNKFPAAVIHIHVPPSSLDVNIHPRKEEVAFANQHGIEKALYTAVSKSLANPHIDYVKLTSVNYEKSTLPILNQPEIVEQKITYPDSTRALTYMPSEYQPSNYTPPAVQLAAVNHQWKLLACYTNTYLLIEHPDGLLLIDQHAAHERILYEKFKARFGLLDTIPLIFPASIELSKQDLVLAINYKKIFNSHGIDIDQLGEQHLIVNAVAPHLKKVNMNELIREIISLLNQDNGMDEDDFFKKINEKIHAQMACKAAVKAGDELTTIQQHQLISDLFESKNQIACPHGRPTRWLLSKYDIDKKFKRIH